MPWFPSTRRMTRHDKSKKGATAIEMALIAPVFFLFMIGATETSLIMLAQHLLENAAFNAARTAKTGYTATGKTQQQTVTDTLNTELGSLAPLIDISQITVTEESYGSINQIGVTGQGTAGLGSGGQVVVYTVSYPWKLFTPMISGIIGDATGHITLTSRIMVQNEPF